MAEDRIFGVMIESHLNEGRQDVVPGKELSYGRTLPTPAWAGRLRGPDRIAGWQPLGRAVCRLHEIWGQSKIIIIVVDDGNRNNFTLTPQFPATNSSYDAK